MKRETHPVKSDPQAMVRILSIAGSDPSGGAGIQADLKTIAALGGYGMSAITALTVQNTQGVSDVMAVPCDFVIAQARAVTGDIGLDAIKTGMLGGVTMIESLAEWLDDSGCALRVIDPVMQAKGGHALLKDQALGAFSSLMVRRASLLTPNAPEAERLTGKAVTGEMGQRRAGEALLKAGSQAVLIKGGHIDGPECIDWLMTQNGEFRFAGPRLISNQTHGTGCSLASALATFLAQGKTIEHAVELARTYVRGAIQYAPGFGHGHGPLNHNWQATQPNSNP